MKTIFNHLKVILKHKYWVAYYCFKCGLYWQGIIHDLSKFSFTEFGESIKFFTGTSSPIDKAKKEQGYSLAWLHHRGRNKHHYEYWTDNYDSGTTCIKIPFKYMIEMVCDYLAAGRAYAGENFTIKSELLYWDNKRKIAKIHPDCKNLIDRFFMKMRCDNDLYLNTFDWKEYIEELRELYESGNINKLSTGQLVDDAWEEVIRWQNA